MSGSRVTDGEPGALPSQEPGRAGQLFRQVLLDRLASPEQLNHAMQITDARRWLGLIGCGVILAACVVWSVLGHVPTKVTGSGILLHGGGLTSILATTEGQITAIEIEPGSTVHRGQAVGLVAQPELHRQQRLIAPSDGRVVELQAAVGDLVLPGTPVATLERAGEVPLEALIYVDSREGKAVHPGMVVELRPSTRQSHGVLLGRVRSVENFPATRQGMMQALRNEQLVDSIASAAGGTPVAIRADLERTAHPPGGYRWSSSTGSGPALTSGTRFSAAITTRVQRPLALLFPALDSNG